MRICFIATGTSVHTKRWLNYFAQRGHDVHLIATRIDDGYDERVREHPLISLLPWAPGVSGYFSGPLWLWQVRRLVRRIAPDVLDAQYIGVPAYLAAASGFHPLILTAKGSDILTVPKRNPLYRTLTRLSLRKADLVVCRTLFMRDEIVKLGASPDKIEICFLGVDTEQFRPDRKSASLRHQLGVSNHEPLVISTRSLKPVYDVETLIRAVPRVIREVPDARFIIAGEGKERTDLERLVRNLGVVGRVKFVGWIANAELPAYLASSDVYVSTSLSDGVPSSLLEAMACGLPPVVTDIPANQAWIEDGKNGFLVPERDPEALAALIANLLQDEKLRTQFGEKSAAIARQKAEHAVQLQMAEEMYLELAGHLRRRNASAESQA